MLYMGNVVELVGVERLAVLRALPASMRTTITSNVGLMLETRTAARLMASVAE